MNGAEFLRLITRLGRARGAMVRYDAQRGKGSHGTLYFDGRRTTLKDPKKEIGPGLLRKMLTDLGPSPRDLENR